MSALPKIELFGSTSSGEAVVRAVLENNLGMRVTILSYGGLLQKIELPNADGTATNVVLGYSTLEAYERGEYFFGALIGRYANRILDARIVVDGKEHILDRNDKFGTVHGGSTGFDKRVWSMEAVPSTDSCAVELGLLSPDGDNGFPGNLTVTVRYELLNEGNTLRMTAEARTDATTVVNLTGHSYFNLSGEGSGTVLDHELLIEAEHFLSVDERLVPTGEFTPVEGTPFDFREPKRIGERIREGHEQLLLGQGYDHNYVLRRGSGAPRLARAARLSDPASGRSLEVWTTEPGLDVYTGNFLTGSVAGTSGRVYRQGDAIALEPEHFTNSPHMPEFPKVLLRPGEVYRTHTEYRFGKG
jgi:aldose 1-epimerase